MTNEVLDNDLDALLDDFDLVEQLEKVAIRDDNPIVGYLSTKWCIEPEELEEVVVAQEGLWKAYKEFDTAVTAMAGQAIGKGVQDTIKLVKMSPALTKRFFGFAAAKTKQFNEKRIEVSGKAVRLERSARKLMVKLNGMDSFPKHPVFTAGWTSKICQEDEVNLNACLGYENRIGKLDDIVEKYTLMTRGAIGKAQKVKEDGLERMGKSSARALKRAAGIMGFVDPLNTVEAWPLPGNVIVVKRGKSEPGRLQYATARDGSYPEKIEQMTPEQAQKALNTVIGLAAFLKDEGARGKVFGYKGISKELEGMKKDLKELDGKELREATLRYNNAVVINEAIITSAVRVAEGLIAYVKASMNKDA